MRSNSARTQQSLPLRFRGGARRGAGRKPARERSGTPHVAREHMPRGAAVHVSVRMADDVWNLRSERSFRVIHAALRALRNRPGFSVVHFDILGNHLHLIAEVDGTAGLESGMRSLSIRLARGLNRMMGRRGKVIGDRYFAHVLRTPAEVRNAIRYVLGNFSSHAARRGETASFESWVDPFSSAGEKAPREAQGLLFVEPATADAQGYLLRCGGILRR
jgi:REP element-mobilizing transposase RayT